MLSILLPAVLYCVDHGIKEHRESNDTVYDCLDGGLKVVTYHNRGAFLNKGEDHPFVISCISVFFTIITTILFLLTFTKKGCGMLKFGLGLLLGGAFSNTYDRLKKGYVVEKEPDAKKYRLMFNQADYIKFSKLMQEARELIKSIYTDTVIEHELISSSFRKTKSSLSEHFGYKSIHGTMPSPANRIDQYFIKDKEVETVKKLKIIFREIQDMFYYFEHKSNAQETIYEYNDAQRRHNVVKDAQSVTRTAQQYVVSVKKASKYLDKYDVMAAEHAFENTKRQVLSGLKKQLDSRIQ